MQLIIDAWLERPTPYLQIVDSETRRPVARFEGVELQQLLADGVVSTEDLAIHDVACQKTLMQELLIAACCGQIRNERECQTCCASEVCPHKFEYAIKDDGLTVD
ncbi:MAG: hypothetical protein P8179_23165 [Candidatus Thiodiazotropha sp.]|jgi:hypothetical protein